VLGPALWDLIFGTMAIVLSIVFLTRGEQIVDQNYVRLGLEPPSGWNRRLLRATQLVACPVIMVVGLLKVWAAFTGG
jgi:hypothetical protein